jgi:hypothetical protein
MSAFLEHVNSVTPDQFGDLRVDPTGDSFAGRAMTPVLATPAIVHATIQVVVGLLTECRVTPHARSTPTAEGRAREWLAAGHPTRAHGAALCQAPWERCVLGWGSVGPGSDCSEVLTWGYGSAALDCRVAPRCPPGLVPAAAFASRIICL